MILGKVLVSASDQTRCIASSSATYKSSLWSIIIDLSANGDDHWSIIIDLWVYGDD